MRLTKNLTNLMLCIAMAVAFTSCQKDEIRPEAEKLSDREKYSILDGVYSRVTGRTGISFAKVVIPEENRTGIKIDEKAFFADSTVLRLTTANWDYTSSGWITPAPGYGTNTYYVLGESVDWYTMEWRYSITLRRFYKNFSDAAILACIF